jgi:hypothetical protein
MIDASALEHETRGTTKARERERGRGRARREVKTRKEWDLAIPLLPHMSEASP